MRLLHSSERVLRARSIDGCDHVGVARTELVAIAALFGAFYGGAMGAFGALEGEQLRQIAFGAIKVPLLLSFTFLLGIPSFFVLNSLAGLQRDFHLVVDALLSTQAAVALVLASLAPITLLWYCSHADYAHAILFNGCAFAISGMAAHRVMRAHYRRLIFRNVRHRLMLRVWLILYGMIAIQMAWLFRPFVGNPNAEIAFFRADAFSQNAYEVVARLVWSLLKQ